MSFQNLGCDHSNLGWSVGVLEYWSIGNNSFEMSKNPGCIRKIPLNPPLQKGGSNRNDRTFSTCAARLLTLVVGWVERQKNGGVRCFNLILYTSHNMQLCEISETHRIMTAQPTLRHDKVHWVTSNRAVRKIWSQKWPV